MASLFIDPGQMRSQMHLQEPINTPDGVGGYEQNWAEITSVFCHISPLRATSSYAGAQYVEEVSHRITMRYRDGVLAGHRLQKGTRLFKIIAVHDVDETQRYLICLTREELQ